jgi:hypothetical protein
VLRRVDEIRWGDVLTLSVPIPAASAATVATAIVQLGNIEVPEATVWAALLGLEWMNQTEGEVADTLTADMFIRCGVGSAEWAHYQQLNVPQASPLSTDDTRLDALPARKIFTSLRLRVETPAAAAARTYVGRVTVMCAPYSLLRGVNA